NVGEGGRGLRVDGDRRLRGARLGEGGGLGLVGGHADGARGDDRESRDRGERATADLRGMMLMMIRHGSTPWRTACAVRRTRRSSSAMKVSWPSDYNSFRF